MLIMLMVRVLVWSSSTQLNSSFLILIIRAKCYDFDSCVVSLYLPPISLPKLIIIIIIFFPLSSPPPYSPPPSSDRQWSHLTRRRLLPLSPLGSCSVSSSKKSPLHILTFWPILLTPKNPPWLVFFSRKLNFILCILNNA